MGYISGIIINMSTSSPFPAAALAAPIDSLPAGWSSQSLSESVTQLTGLFALLRELLRTEAMWLVAVPYWDAKQAIARHVLEEATHAEAILKRLHELKATSAEHQQMTGLEEFIRTIASAQHADEWLRTLYTRVKPWLIGELQSFLDKSDPVMDEPSHRVIAKLIPELQLQVDWFSGFTPQFSDWECEDTEVWDHYVSSLLTNARIEKGTLAVDIAPFPRPEDKLFQVVETVGRDRTFKVMKKSDLPSEGTTFAEKRFLIFYHHTQEMLFAESLCAILYETSGMPWAFHYDIARHIADEVRHASMGQSRLENLGVSLTEIPMFRANYEFRQRLNPLERFCLMTLSMEANSFDTKRGRAKLLEEHGDQVSALYEYYDIRDEMMHANLGHVWVPVMSRVYHSSRSMAALVKHCDNLKLQQNAPEYAEAPA